MERVYVMYVCMYIIIYVCASLSLSMCVCYFSRFDRLKVSWCFYVCLCYYIQELFFQHLNNLMNNKEFLVITYYKDSNSKESFLIFKKK